MCQYLNYVTPFFGLLVWFCTVEVQAVMLDIVDLTEFSSDDDDEDKATMNEIVLTHVRTERVSFSKGGKSMK